MSVSDPLLKRLKGFIKDLRTDPGVISDSHPSVYPFCENLELIFRKGLKQTTNFFGRNNKDYWNWIDAVGEVNNNNNSHDRINPIFSMVKYAVKNCKKVTTNQGRGRYFIREALQKKNLCVPIEMLLKNQRLLENWYEPGMSIIGDEILSEILMSLLFETTEVNFQLNTQNCSFLDQTWVLPVYKYYQLVPCSDLGVKVQFIDGRALVTEVDPLGVAGEDNKVVAGDVLDELVRESLRGTRKSKIYSLLKQVQGFPVGIGVIKCHHEDGSIFCGIKELLGRVSPEVASIQAVLGREAEAERLRRFALEEVGGGEGRRIPPHAQLPGDEYEELPVHNPEDRAHYVVEMLGRTELGNDGGVQQVEVAVGHQQAFTKGKTLTRVVLELGETDVIITDLESKELLFKHSYTEISSCGRTLDCTETFAYIAGETTCTLAKQFIAYVFKAASDEESKTILCTIAQGFGRTHWYV